MAILGRWVAPATINVLPTTAWTAPANLFTSESRNDGSAYSFSAATSTLTLPTSDLADGYLVTGYVRIDDTSNGRHNPQARFVQTGGTGNFLSAFTGGYSRDNSEDIAYVRVWAFVDSPSASSTIQFQWKRDTDAPAGGTTNAVFDVVPFYYQGIGMAQSTSTQNFGGTTVNQVTGFSTLFTPTGGVFFATEQFALGISGRYLCLGSGYIEGVSNRTQRWFGFREDGVKDDSSRAYAYHRNASNANSGGMYSNIYESTGSTVIDTFSYRGDGVAAGQGGASNDNASITSAQYAMVVLHLNDNTEVFRSRETTQGPDLNVTGPVDLDFIETVDFADAASFTKSTNAALTVNSTADFYFAANISAAQQVPTVTSRWTAEADLTLNGVEDVNTQHGNYARNTQGGRNTYGWSAHPSGFIAATSGNTIGVSVQELAGGEDGGEYNVMPGWGGFWGINLDTLQSLSPTRRVFLIS